MDEYAKSLQDVDAALNRLKATLASYKPFEKSQNGDESSHAYADSLPSSAAKQAAIEKPQAAAKDLSTIRERPQLHVTGTWKEVLDLRSSSIISAQKPEDKQLQPLAEAIRDISRQIDENSYCAPLYVLLALKYLFAGYPDLASGAAYKALLLADAVQDAADEYHDRACEAMRKVIQQQPLVERISLLKGELHADAKSSSRLGEPDEETDVEVDVWLREHYLLLTYRMLVRSLILVGCCRSAHEYSLQGRRLYPQDSELEQLQHVISAYAVAKCDDEEESGPSSWLDHGMVRREVYPWNEYEPDRLNELPQLNVLMEKVAPQLEVKVVDLPELTGLANGQSDAGSDPAISTQLGVFAKQDLQPNNIVLDETSMLTANNKLQDALCDACSADLPDLGGDDATGVTACPDCEVVFCSEPCLEAAMESYHPALCGMDVEAIAKDVPPAQAADSLYALLLLRALAMAETQECHPLELSEVKYIWGDFHSLPLAQHWQSPQLETSDSGAVDRHQANMPRTLPFSFEHNVRLPFHMLEKMDIDIFASQMYDVWVFNTLYAKFRGTASARLSGLGGRPIRGPEVSAVHPMWCLANHHCDPNVSWDWGGSIKFKVLDWRPEWASTRDGVEPVRRTPGIKKGEEILNHYCDIRLPVHERREWMVGALGGNCMCERCRFEEENHVEGK
ncbi:hypothetical protein KC333_g1600 [Hortaea werneckii]|nr:hypothetical protein KC333_g1600 [Hortaea werneckii]KAI7322536.1 hypothetical protein KC326_g1852 [Hortaea werneckii]